MRRLYVFKNIINMSKKILLVSVLMLSVLFAKAQNFQIFYDFGETRKQVTTTAELFKADPWGNTYSFIDLDFTFRGVTNEETGKVSNIGIGGAYFEIARCLNFWQKTKASFLSIQLEYNGGLGTYPTNDNTKLPTLGTFSVNHAFLGGADFFVHSNDYKFLFNFKVLYKKYLYYDQTVPMQLTFVWTMNDLFGAKGLTFNGFADWWGQNQTLTDKNGVDHNTYSVFITEPQIWYSVGQWFGCPQLNIGCEIECSNHFGSTYGFVCNPCVGIKWNFETEPNKSAAVKN